MSTEDFVAYDLTITQEDTPTMSFIMDDDGTPTDVSAWTVYYAADHEDSSVADTISIATGNVTKSDSGTGTVDTFNIPLTSSDTDITAGRYKHRVRVKIGTHIDTVAEGILTIKEKERTAV